MTATVTCVKLNDVNKDIFFEGNLVISDRGDVYLVTVPAMGYDECSPDTFWGIRLTGSNQFRSGGNYLKSLFKQFVGEITLEGKY